VLPPSVLDVLVNSAGQLPIPLIDICISYIHHNNNEVRNPTLEIQWEEAEQFASSIHAPFMKASAKPTVDYMIYPADGMYD
jgi:hypothetical protein